MRRTIKRVRTNVGKVDRQICGYDKYNYHYDSNSTKLGMQTVTRVYYSE